MEKCIVCGMEVKISRTTELTTYENKTYYFCTALCKVLFLQEPGKYLSKAVNNNDNKK